MGERTFGDSGIAAATVQENVADLQFGPEFGDIQIRTG